MLSVSMILVDDDSKETDITEACAKSNEANNWVWVEI